MRLQSTKSVNPNSTKQYMNHTRLTIKKPKILSKYLHGQSCFDAND